jgi:predicted metalloprotease with PDZ domain
LSLGRIGFYNLRASALRRAALVFAVFLFLLASAVPAGATIGYRVSLANPEQHVFQVSMTVPVDGQQLVIALPAWNTLYQIRDFAVRIRNVGGSCAAVPLEMDMVDKQTWRASLRGPCEPNGHNKFEIKYSVFWNDGSPFDSQLNSHHAFVNLAEILMYVPDRRAEDVFIAFINMPAGWKTAAQLDSPAEGGNVYSAPTYDALVDAPVEAGNFEEFQFPSGGARFRVIVDAAHWDKAKLEDALRKITTYEMELMGGSPPFKPPERGYMFIFHIGGFSEVGGGGMEHANSTAISGSSVDSVAATAAHEFFHVWNVKRIRPQALEPVDYSREQYTRALWFAEGVTNTYSAFTLERTSLWSKKQFYADLSSQISDLQSRPAREWQSAEDSSVEAWFEKYEGYNAPDRSISYYTKGQILGVLLDLAIRDATDNRRSLDDVFRRMNVEYAEQHKFYNESEGIRAAIEEVAGKSFQDFFDRYVSGTAEIPYNELLGRAGLELKSGPAGEEDGRSSIVETAHPSERQRHILDGFLRGRTD